MKCLMLLTVLVFASKNENNLESVAANSGEKNMENARENSIVLKIDKDESDTKKSKNSNCIGVHYDETTRKWVAKRWSTVEKKYLTNGRYKDEETATHASDTLARKLMENGEQNHKLNFPDDDTEVYTEEITMSSEYLGVFYEYNPSDKRWVAHRWSSSQKKYLNNGYYKDEETAAHASDTLARKLMANGEHNVKLNFPDDNTDHEKTKTSKYFGVTYNEKSRKWCAQRWRKTEKKIFNNGYYKNQEIAARASDTLARKLMANGEHHKLNFPDDNTEVEKTKTSKSKYFGVTYNARYKRWSAQRWSKTEKKIFNNGYHKDEETAAHASDTLARNIMANGEEGHKLNFPDDSTEVSKYQTKKRKRSFDFDSQSDRNDFEKFEEKEK